MERPHPAATGRRADPGRWREADLRFDRDAGWLAAAANDDALRSPWPIKLAGLTLELRATEAGQVGLFPEHAAMLPWLREFATRRGGGAEGAEQPPAVLNLFAYTGLVTLGLATAGASVVHVDASRPTVAWARRNADLSGLAEAPIRWIVDDAAAFVAREARRGRRYAGIVLDPPTYGHGPGSKAWRIDRDLAPLVALCAPLLGRDGFVLVTAHTEGLAADDLVGLFVAGLDRPRRAVETGDLQLVSVDGRRLRLGAFARSAGRS